MKRYFVTFSRDDDPQDVEYYIVSEKSVKAAEAKVLKREGDPEPCYLNAILVDDLIKILQRHSPGQDTKAFIGASYKDKPGTWRQCLEGYDAEGRPLRLDALTGEPA